MEYSIEEKLEEQMKINKRLKKRINLAKKLLKQYIGVLDDTADLYFENVLSILLDEEVK